MKSNEKVKVLIIDDEGPIRQVLSATLQDEGYQVATAESGEMGLEKIKEFQPEVVLLDIWMPGSLDGLDVLREARRHHPQIDIVMMSGHGTIETAVRATRMGAWDFIEKPLSMDKIIVALQNLLSYRAEKEEKQALLNHLRRNIALLGECSPMVQLKQMIARCAPQENWILIEGERGTGRELVARNIHYMSPRASRNFVELSVHTTPSELLETELFGFEKGFYPGAEKGRKGRLELAHQGTLYIDELGDLSPVVQQRLLDFLINKTFLRQGGTELLSVDVRILGASSKNLAVEVKEGRWSQALYDRLISNALLVPPLRERKQDIPTLLNYFSTEFMNQGRTSRKTMSAAALERLQDYSWPGNVRELRNFVERLYILTPGDFVDVHDLRFAGLISDLEQSQSTEKGTFREARAEFEKHYLTKKINDNNGNITRTAEAIGLERSYLHRKIKSYGLEVKGE